MTAYDFTIARHKGENYFSGSKDGSTLLFNQLMAFDCFYGGKIEVFRGGSKIEETACIGDLGGHYNGNAGFRFLGDIFNDAADSGSGLVYIGAQKLSIGDKVILTLPNEGGQEHVLDTIYENVIEVAQRREKNRPDMDDLFAPKKPAPIDYSDGKIVLNYCGL